MPAEYMSIRDDGSWKTVKHPWIRDDDSWKKVHKVWVRDGGAWKVGHITRHTNYTTLATDTYESSGSITISAGVRWLQVTITGHGGGGGGAAGATPHYACSSSTMVSDPYHWHSAAGGDGGDGGKVNAIFEVREGGEYSWVNLGIPDGGLANNRTFNNQSFQGDLSLTAGSYFLGGSGDKHNIIFSTDNPNGSTDISMTGEGGAGGAGGKITADATCTNSGGTYGYTLSNTFGADGSNGSGSVNVTTGTLYGSYIQSGTGKSGATGGQSGNSTVPALSGNSPAQSGFIEIIQYGIN